MSWEQRNGKGRYYTRSVWHDGRVQRLYFGAGTQGELAAAHYEKERHHREAETAAWVAQQTRWQTASEPLFALSALTDTLLHATLHAAGYHQHHRGEWRCRRSSSSSFTVSAIEAVVDDETWRRGLALIRQARRSWLELVAGPDLLLREGLARHLAAVTMTLPGTWPARLEHLLQQRVALAQLRLVCFHGWLARQRACPRSKRRLIEQYQGQAQREFLRAIKAMVLLRRVAGYDQTGGGTGRGTRSSDPDSVSAGVLSEPLAGMD